MNESIVLSCDTIKLRPERTSDAIASCNVWFLSVVLLSSRVIKADI